MIRCWPPPPGQRRDGNPGQVGRRRASWCPAATDRPGVLDPALLRPGRREGSNVLLPAEKHAVAVHESGHALVAALAEHADPVAKVTILPAGQTPGVTEQPPLVERHMYGEDYLLGSLAVRRGVRAAELVVLGQGSARARPGLDRGRQRPGRGHRPGGQGGPRVRHVIGPRAGRVPDGGSVFHGGGGPGMSSRSWPKRTRPRSTARSQSCSVRRRAAAVQVLQTHRAELDALVGLLLDRETVDGSDVYRLAGRPDKSAGLAAPRASATTRAIGERHWPYPFMALVATWHGRGRLRRPPRDARSKGMRTRRRRILSQVPR